MMDVRRRGGKHYLNGDGDDVNTPEYMNDNSSIKRKYEKHNSTSSTASVGYVTFGCLISFCVGLFLLVGWSHVRLPDPLGFSVPSSVFSETRARVHLDAICDLGARIVGTVENEVKAPEYILKELDSIQKLALKGIDIEIEVQKPSGSFWLDFLGGFTSQYHDVTNIVVRVSASGLESKRDAILMSGHFDTSIGGPGASDDAASVAVSLELIRVLATRNSSPLPTAIIFLFNGAEETILQASHGFITQHRWVPTIRAFVNVEGAGAGGREVVFQTGPGHAWLAYAYAESAPHPFGTVMGQDIFQSGIIPSDTDFRIYRDFGNLPGIDIAFIANGYAYHTQLDTPSRIEPGAIQRCGENLIALLDNMGSSGIVTNADVHRHSHAVFFDVLGFYMITYSDEMALLLNWGSIATTFIWLVYTGFFSSWGAVQMFRIISALLAGVFSTGVLGFIMHSVLRSPFSWFANPDFGRYLYGFPSLGIFLFVLEFTEKGDLISMPTMYSKLDRAVNTNPLNPIESQRRLFVAGIALFWVILVLLSSFDLGSSYFFLLWTSPAIIGCLLRERFQGRGALWNVTSCVIFFVSISMGAIQAFQLSHVCFSFFSSLLGRSGNKIIPDVVLAVLVSLLTLVSSIIPATLWPLLPRRKVLVSSLAFLTFVCMMYGCTLPSYDAEHPKRLIIQHTNRQFGDSRSDLFGVEDSGLWINTLDALGHDMLFDSHPFYKNARLTGRRNDALYDDMPWFFSLAHMVDGSVWSPMPTPTGASNIDMTVISDTYNTSAATRSVHVRVEGENIMTLAFSAGIDSPLIAWSFTPDLPAPMDGHRFVFMSNASGKTHEFSITFKIDEHIDFALSTHVLRRSEEAQELIDSLPDWVDACALVCSWKSFTL